MTRVVGLMSGTSVDGIDAALVNICGQEIDLEVNLLAFETYSYPADLREQILAVCAGERLTVEQLAKLDDAIATAFTQAALNIQQGHSPATLIGSHGQTVFHRPPMPDILGYSLQLGRGELIAQRTNIATISNFRAADLAIGGQGAPLVPKVDLCLLSDAQQSRCVQNIGGMGNVTFLPPLKTPEQLGVGVQGWDTGPGNVLIDLAVQQFSDGQQTYDRDGAWAASGTPCQALVDQWLTHPFFAEPPPKSTGRELFSPQYLQSRLQEAQAHQLSEADIIATLTELTAASIALNYTQFLPQLPDQVLLAGGGSLNHYLRQRLTLRLGGIPVLTTDEVGLNADAKEAIAFAVLAYWHHHQIPGNLPAVTGAKRSTLLGTCHEP
ncbi:Anhydro-N-acetylmuramic acid kinase [Acaryochloris thomasi RCC1774]|uniref:Anhydro-N-acetylmuramic acid kinase n=1 Tax=Acaryochloris thomasi RCC1774 TaxID=1764569 RepID=A0A2W1JDM8_9CYAN|nr:anhydro-N-acetylmuramic acid kinase [Acaryochloris thomasi]PZD71899.1 Anhydro-N-acetylmuramic acid kinase [Acaryochloris thomasi RCC1774]